MAQSLTRWPRGRTRQKRRLFLEQLEGRSLMAAVITVNSIQDNDVRDESLTLREAIEISNRTLDVASLTSTEQAQVSGTPTDADTDAISFNIPGQGGINTIALQSALPIIF